MVTMKNGIIHGKGFCWIDRENRVVRTQERDDGLIQNQ